MAELPFHDISYAQGEYNMDTDPDQIIAMKASGFYTGSLLPYLDTQLVRNYADAIRLGKVPILYHFAGGSDPSTEAAYFIAAVHPLAVGDVYALDWEIEHPDPVNWVNTFMQKVHAATGVWPLVYMDIDRVHRFDWSPVFKNCGLWLAAPSYSFDANVPDIPVPYVAQQGPIVNGVDTDMWFGTLEELKDYGYKVPQPTTPPPAPVTPAPSPAPTVVTNTPSPTQTIDIVKKPPVVIPPAKPPTISPLNQPKKNWFLTLLLDLWRGI